VIVDPAVEEYVTGLEPEPDAVLQDMHAHAARDGIPIVHRSTGGLLEVLARGRAVEVGTAIGVSTLHLARGGAHVISFEVDRERHEAAKDYLSRSGLGDRVDLRLQDASEGLEELEPNSFDLGFIDGPKDRYGGHLEQVVKLLKPGGLLLVDNVLMLGSAATGRPTGPWRQEQVDAIRAFNAALAARDDLRATFTPIGDGVAIAVRQ
jgi:caffeoyl-CoA O-methyltransferase